MLENRVINTILGGVSSRQPKISKGTTARGTVDKKPKKAGWTSWSIARTVAHYKAGWTDTVTPLCTSWHEER